MSLYENMIEGLQLRELFYLASAIFVENLRSIRESRSRRVGFMLDTLDINLMSPTDY